jgi:phosphoribosylformimino-5-aminoimidazole carboxamide ribotide isomerase
MLLIPSIDIKGGKCLAPGKASGAAFSEDPAALARQWVKAGARRLHLADLDSGSGKAANAAAVEKVVAACPEVPVQVSGGVRSEEGVAAYIEAGAHFVVLGMRALTTPHFVNDLCMEFPGHIIVGLEARDGKLASEGWSKLSDNDAAKAAEHLQREGAAAIVYAQAAGKGMDAGCIEGAAELARAVAIPVIAAAGVTTLADVRKLCAPSGEGLLGAILGQALYEGALDLTAAQKLADSLATA